jgi:anti-sigma regulatory factor (Ser/Thr protein kinase)
MEGGGMLARDSRPLDLRFQAMPECVSLFRERLAMWLEDVGAGGRDVPDVVLACSEAFANAVEHPLTSVAGQVEVHGDINDQTVSVTIRDYGLWRANSQREERGLGFRMMRSLMDAVEVVASPEGTFVTLRRRLAEGTT